MNKKSVLSQDLEIRTDEFRPNPKLDSLIADLKIMLQPVQFERNEDFIRPSLPVVLVLGASRSGTTLISQILAATGDFAYPTNFLSRFAYAPMIGAMIQQMLFDPEYDFRGELSDLKSSSTFDSNLGKTNNALGISEFFHFWRKFFPNHEPSYLSEDDLSKVDVSWMCSELATIESIFKKPFVSKCKMMQYNASFFAKKIPQLFFLHIKRNPYFVMQSILRSRRRFYGRDDIWWAIKPREYKWLSHMDSWHQIAGQVFFTENNIDEELKFISNDRKLVCTYESLCVNPRELYEELRQKLNVLGVVIKHYDLQETFKCDNIDKSDVFELEMLAKAYDNFVTGKIQVNDQ